MCLNVVSNVLGCRFFTFYIIFRKPKLLPIWSTSAVFILLFLFFILSWHYFEDFSIPTVASFANTLHYTFSLCTKLIKQWWPASHPPFVGLCFCVWIASFATFWLPIWLKLKLIIYYPHLPPRNSLNSLLSLLTLYICVESSLSVRGKRLKCRLRSWSKNRNNFKQNLENIQSKQSQQLEKWG